MVAEMPKKLQQVLFDHNKINAKKFMEMLDNLQNLDRDKTFEFVVNKHDLYMVFELIKASKLFSVDCCYEIEGVINTGKTFAMVSCARKDGRVAKVEVRLIDDVVHTTTTNLFSQHGHTFIWLTDMFFSQSSVPKLNMNFDFASINDGGQAQQS